MAWLGRISYGVFLWHVPVFIGLYAVSGARVFAGGFGALLALLSVGRPATLLLAWLSHRFVEEPLMRRTRGSGREEHGEEHGKEGEQAGQRLDGRRTEGSG